MNWKCIIITFYYVPRPISLDPCIYDLVDNEEFCKPDGRTPLLIVTQFCIFPTKDSYPGKSKDYTQLEGLENQNVAFIGRGYLSLREYGPIIEFFLDSDTLKKISSKVIKITLSDMGFDTSKILEAVN